MDLHLPHFQSSWNRSLAGCVLFALSLFLLGACTTSPDELTVQSTSLFPTAVPPIEASYQALPFVPPTRGPNSLLVTPTPDSPHAVPTPRTESAQYTVRSGDSLKYIAAWYGISVKMLVEANQISNPDLIYPGQALVIPPPTPSASAPDFKTLPDSELVRGPVSAAFDTEAYLKSHSSALSSYTETVDGETLGSAEIIQRIAVRYSVNPRLLLALLEYQNGWLSQASLPVEALDYPLDYKDSGRKGLYLQLAWASDTLNRGYYLWKVNGISAFITTDSSIVSANPAVNPGTAAVQQFASQLFDLPNWQKAVSPEGIFATYRKFFNNPFDMAIEPLLPASLTQPPMQLPFEDGIVWSFTGGPHGGYGDGSAWAALDFAPPGDALGCVQSEAWVTAAAGGKITYSGQGLVVEALDASGYDPVGWSVVYLHVETRDRIPQGSEVRAGDHIGHPSCEGGVSNGTHVHIARRYNGEWISADGNLPYNLDGWVSEGAGIVYDGILKRNGTTVEAWNARKPENQIHR